MMMMMIIIISSITTMMAIISGLEYYLYLVKTRNPIPRSVLMSCEIFKMSCLRKISIRTKSW